jgi:hypothetical protein
MITKTERRCVIQECVQEVQRLIKIRSSGEYGCALFEAMDVLKTLRDEPDLQDGPTPESIRVRWDAEAR